MAERETWSESLQSLGTSVLDLIKVEAAAAAQDFKVFFTQVAKLLAVAAVSLVILFYVPFLVLFTVLDGISAATGYPYWGSGLILLGAVLLFLGLVGAITYFVVIRKMENPVQTVQRRLDDHRGWWRHEIFEEPRRLDDTRGSLGRGAESTQGS